MTGFVSIFLALVGGLIAANRREIALVIGVPYLVVMALQSWSIGSGQGVSPPSTVTQFPGLISYFVVQAIIVAFTLLAADQIRLLRLRRTGEIPDPADSGRRTTRGLVANIVAASVVVAVVLIDRPFFDPGSVTHHTTSGSPPVIGILGTASCFIVFVILGVVTLVSRRGRTAAPYRAAAG